MRWLTWLAWRELRAGWRRAVLALTALALSSGLVAAGGSLGALMQAGLARPALAGGRPADLWVASAYDVDYDLPAALAAEAAAVDGVAAVLPVLRRPVRVETRAGSPAAPHTDRLALLGVDLPAYLARHELRLAAGRLPAGQEMGLVALAPWAAVQHVTPGQAITLTTPAGEVALPLTGLVEVDGLAAAQHGPALYAPREQVAAWYGAGSRATLLEVWLAPGTPARRTAAALERALGPAYVLSGGGQAAQGTQPWQRLVLGGLIAVDGLVLAGSVALVYGVFAAAARARRREIGLLRVAGARQRQVFALVLLEAGLLGLAGSGLGLCLAALLGPAGGRWVLGTEAGAAIPPWAAALGLGAGLAAGLIGAARPAWRAARQPPLQALFPAWHACPPDSRARPTAAAVPRARRPAARLPGAARLAVAGLARQPRRAVLMAGSLALIVAMALGSTGILSLLGHELQAAAARLSGSDYVLLPGPAALSLRELAGQDTSDLPPLDAGLLAALDALGGQITVMRGTTADMPELQVLPGQPVLLVDVAAYAQLGGFRFVAGDWPAALAAFRRGPAVLLAPAVARRLGATAGDTLPLHTPRGPVDFVVAGVGEAELPACVLDLAQAADYLGANEVSAAAVQVRPGADREAARRALLDAVQRHGATLVPMGEVAANLRAVVRQVQRPAGLLIAVTAVVAGLGIVNAVLSGVAERRREIGLWRAAGATRRQVARLILAEMAVLGLAAAGAGSLLGWGATGLFVLLAAGKLGLGAAAAATPAAWLPLAAATAAGLVLAPVLAMLAGLAPALWAARLPIVAALRE